MRPSRRAAYPPGRPTLSEVYFDGACRNQAWFQANVVSTGFELDWVQGPQWKRKATSSSWVEGHDERREAPEGRHHLARASPHAGYPMLAGQ